MSTNRHKRCTCPTCGRPIRVMEDEWFECAACGWAEYEAWLKDADEKEDDDGDQ